MFGATALRRAAQAFRPVLTTTIISISLCAQGDFVNFEPPVVHGIDVAHLGTLATHDFVLVCNVDDDTVEIIDTWNHNNVVRVHVGLAPVTVRWVQSLSRFYTANYIGDSVSIVDLALSGNTPVATLVRTSNVGDAPVDVGLNPTTGQLDVILSSSSQVAFFDRNTLALGWAAQIDNFTFHPPPWPNPRIMKEPRRIEYFGTLAHVLSLRGDSGNTLPGNVATTSYRFGLFRLDWSTALSSTIENDLGSTNMGMAISSAGEVFVAGSFARNDIETTANLKSEVVNQTGFVTSNMWRVKPSLAVDSRDLNNDAGGNRVGVGSRVSMPSDIALLENSSGVSRVFITSYQTDRLVVLDATTTNVKTWPSQSVTIPPPTSGNYSMAGPRCLVLKAAVLSEPLDPGPRLYCLNRLDASVSVFNPTVATPVELARVPLAHDPTPNVIRAGRRFLFDARLSTEGTVACASCHVDARTDGLAWRLGDASATAGPLVPTRLVDSPMSYFIPPPPLTVASPTFDSKKGVMVTQSLQGLLNHPINGDVRDLVTNAPYHWRGDKPDFTDFNEAFFNLMATTNLGTSNDPRGLSIIDMEAFRAYIETIMYPPNPLERKDRTYPSTSSSGNGLSLFHTRAINFTNPAPGHEMSAGVGQCRGRSCVHCHALPEGSNNRVTVGSVFGTPLLQPGNIPTRQPIESAALRGIQSREGKVFSPTAGVLLPVATSGLSHSGDGTASITEFVHNLFSLPPPLVSDFSPQELNDVVAFMQEFDTGTAPGIGQVLTIDNANGNWSALGLLEREAKHANAGVAVRVQRAGTVLGLYYDVTLDRYVIEGTSLGYTRSDLTNAFTAGDLLIAQGTPLGSERRIASASGSRTLLPPGGPAPANVLLKGAAPATHWNDVPTFTQNANTLSSPPFVWGAAGSAPSPVSIAATERFQSDLIAGGVFGLTTFRHEAPRRLCVTCDNIRLGAQLNLYISTNSATPPPYASLPGNTRLLVADLHPTDTLAPTPDGRRIWETTVELAPEMLYALMCGGPAAPGVQATLDGTPTATQPQTWNKFFVVVLNEDNQASPGVWQTLTIQ